MTIVDIIFDFLIKQNDLESGGRIKKIKKILFRNFNEKWKSSNQKLDFSFSFRKKNEDALRFSYNNFGEKEKFYRKILDIFKIFGDEYDSDRLKRILDKLKSRTAEFQTTFGLEWLAGENLPRLKIYFEEIHQSIQKKERAEMAQKIAKIINFDYKKTGVNEKSDIGAICVDFLAQKKINFKIYLISDKISVNSLRPILKERVKLIKAVEKFLNIFSLEKMSFYYTTYRLDCKKTKSVKIYKIYDVDDRNYTLANKEIFEFLRSPFFGTGESKRKIINLLAYAAENKIFFYPVIASIDLPLQGDPKIDLYLSIK
ncbi:hypothetical protein A3C24_04045 [Candidatus Roizmanbacteria bacterium RIFCSPHIGHO2_02_FULL_37_24]|uniref:Uncharacterized protein n=1 Tax=Candidatus Roizmanbacteria bacterium RIFCSPHIGHO2_02_FULL_37_24 TaxID=1802037 RepID=A0A1F7GUN1_9BACT|nr:MAG: hypothetical protein A3C24_04045 [Candidatus Roizmanbacteria bacterium RIFCSPHIGHO2_02_FULL_37_24]HLD62029.1 hypothetical protein [Patescibacteria group bacterium]